MYVIQRTSDSKYVTPPGSEKSYTNALQNARVFDTRGQAEAECCGNERVVPVSEALHGRER